MVGGGGHADQRTHQTAGEEFSVLLAVTPWNVRAGPPQSAAMGNQAIAGRRSGIRRRAGQRAQIAERLYGYVRPHDLAVRGLSLPRAARTRLARSAGVLDGRCRA